MKTAADELIAQLPESSDLHAAAEVLRDQATTHFCGTQARMTMPITVGDSLELAVALGTVLNRDQIVRQQRPTRKVYTPPTFDAYAKVKAPDVETTCPDEDGVIRWKPWQ